MQDSAEFRAEFSLVIQTGKDPGCPMNRYVLIAVCLLIIQTALGAHAEDVERSGPEAETVAPAYKRVAEDYSGAVVVIPSSDSLALRASAALLEDVLQEIAERTRTTLSFLCDDPTQNRVRVTKRLTVPTLAQLLDSLLGHDYPDKTVRSLEASSQDQESGLVIALSVKTCARGATPVRIFRPISGHPLMTKSLREITREELSLALRTEGPTARRRAVHLLTGTSFLARIGGRDGLLLLREAVRDRHPRVMLTAAQGLARLGPRYGRDEAARAIHDRLREDRYYELVIALARLDGQRAWPVLEELITSSDETARAVVLNALVLTKDARGIAWLSRVALTAELGDARTAAIVIGKIGGREAGAALIDVLRAGFPDRAAMAAQGVYFLPESERGEAEVEIGRILRKSRENDEMVAGLSALSFFGPLDTVLSDARAAPELKSKILGILGANGTERAIGTIAIGLGDRAWPVRLRAVEALGAIGTVEAAPHLIRATHDDRPAVRAAALLALSGSAGEPPVMAALAEGLSDPSEEARKAAIDAIDELGQPNEEIEGILLMAALTSEDPYVSDKAGSILRSWGVEPEEFCTGEQTDDPELCGARPAQ